MLGMVFRKALLFVQVHFFTKYALLLPRNQAVGGGGSKQTQTPAKDTAFIVCAIQQARDQLHLDSFL